jgi:hypothetical protein
MYEEPSQWVEQPERGANHTASNAGVWVSAMPPPPPHSSVGLSLSDLYFHMNTNNGLNYFNHKYTF